MPKQAVPKARITVDGVTGDSQGTPKVHGGPDRAVCLFSLDVLNVLQAEGHPIGPGSSGENLTVAEVDWAKVAPGDRIRIGDTVLLEVASYTTPCEHNARWFKDGDVHRISQNHYPGSSRLYARVLAEGTVRTGDPVVIEGARGEGLEGVRGKG